MYEKIQIMSVNTIKSAKIYLKENFFLSYVSLAFLKIHLINWIFLICVKMHILIACTENYADLWF